MLKCSISLVYTPSWLLATFTLEVSNHDDCSDSLEEQPEAPQTLQEFSNACCDETKLRGIKTSCNVGGDSGQPHVNLYTTSNEYLGGD